MKYYFGGAEINTWKDLLIEENVPTVALSYMGLKRRFKDLSSWRIADNYPSWQKIFLDSGAYTLNREDSDYSYNDAVKIAKEYHQFVNNNIDSVVLVSEFDALIMGDVVLKELRKDYDGIDPAKFMPVWHEDDGVEALDSLCSSYEIVGVTISNMHDTSLISTFNQMIGRYGVRLHGVAITSKDMMKSVKFDSVSSMSWLSPSQFGDTIIWTGKELKRYPRAYKSSRKQHRTWIDSHGFNAEKIEADDSRELLKLSLWSWQQFVNSLDGVTTLASPQNNGTAEIGMGTVDTHGINEKNGKLLPAVQERRETTLLPVMGIRTLTEENDDGSKTETPFVVKRSESMRACNTCFLKLKCIGFQANSNCMYNIPIEVKTKEQLTAVKNAIVEMQTQRVLFMQMAEDLEGGYADPNLSSELDRLSRLIKAKEESERDTFTMTINASQANQGKSFMERHFGEAAHSKLQQLESPVVADDLLKESDIFEAEIVDD